MCMSICGCVLCYNTLLKPGGKEKLTQQTQNVVTTLWQGCNVIQQIHNVSVTLMPQSQDYNVASKLSSKFNSRCTMDVVLTRLLSC